MYDNNSTRQKSGKLSESVLESVHILGNSKSKIHRTNRTIVRAAKTLGHLH